MKQVLAFMHLLHVYQLFFGQPNNFLNRYNVISLSFLLTLRYFVYFFDLVIFVNAIFIAVDQNDGEIFFLAIFNLEIILKIYTYGFKTFFSHFWNMYHLNIFSDHFSSFEIFRMVLFFRFDFLVIVSATLALIIESSYESCK